MSQASIEAARTIWEHLNSAVGAREILKLNQSIERVEILEPHHENRDWANAALVVHMKDGGRYGLEVCPFPEFPAMPSATLRTMTTEPEQPTDPEAPAEPEPTEDPSTVTAPGDEPPVPVQPPYENPV